MKPTQQRFLATFASKTLKNSKIRKDSTIFCFESVQISISIEWQTVESLYVNAKLKRDQWRFQPDVLYVHIFISNSTLNKDFGRTLLNKFEDTMN